MTETEAWKKDTLSADPVDYDIRVEGQLHRLVGLVGHALPVLRILMQMSDGKNEKHLILDRVDEPVRKSVKATAPR